MRILTALFFAVTITAAAQSPQVPHKMEFAGITLSIRDDARREIQKDVDALTRSPKHFMIKAEKARTYFPIIEKIFEEEGVPEDFKYLVLQESSLIADAVSVSNAVGYWQFKDFTALEMGLRVDKEIDERMNIASSTRGAARYIKKNNTFFNNWIYALQAYQMGAGAVLRSEKDIPANPSHFEITSSTYWYVKKFLSYKIAYQDVVEEKGELQVTVYENKSKKTLADLSRELSVDEVELRNYNKWIRGERIPDDRTYIVVVPGAAGVSFETLSTVLAAKPAPVKTETAVAQPAREPMFIKINGVRAVQAVQGDDAAKVAARANVDLASFLEWNDISATTPIIPQTFYFLGKKRAKAIEDYHTVKDGENLWSVSQKYGVRMKKLKRYNRLQHESVSAGTTLWLSSRKPRSSGKSVPEGAVATLDHQDEFAWGASARRDSATLIPVANTEAPIVVVVIEKPDSASLEVPKDSVKNLQLTQETAITQDTVRQIIIPVNQPDKHHHIVTAKETLYAIAKIYNVGVMDLVNWNNLDLQQGIKIGQVLRVTSPEIAAESTKTTELIHEVGASDTLYSIARKYGVTIKDLMDWNEKKDFAISAGEKLKIKLTQ